MSTLGEDITNILIQVLFICEGQGLIGREMFAIDGVKLPSNASKAKSGTRADFERQAGKLEAAEQGMLARHREHDDKAIEPELPVREKQRIEHLKRDAAQVREWLTEHPEDRRGSKGSIRKSNHNLQVESAVPIVPYHSAPSIALFGRQSILTYAACNMNSTFTASNGKMMRPSSVRSSTPAFNRAVTSP